MTRLLVCDRCGTMGRESKRGEGERVVSLTFQPWQRRIELCGGCRRHLNDYINEWLDGGTAT